MSILFDTFVEILIPYMRRFLFLLIALAATCQAFAIDFFGVKLGGPADELCTRLAAKGLKPCKRISDDLSRSVDACMQADSLMFFEGTLSGRRFTGNLRYLSADQLVESLRLSFEGTSQEDVRSITTTRAKAITGRYGRPCFEYDSRTSSKKKRQEVIDAFGRDDIEICKVWDCKSGFIFLAVPQSSLKVEELYY